MNMAMRAAPHQDPLAEMHPYLAGDCVGAGRRPVGLRFGLWAQLYRRDVVIGKPMCSLKGNASVAGGQRSAAPGVMEDLFPKRNASLDISDCSLKGNASVAGGQRSPRCDGGFVPKRNAGGWIFFGYQGAGFMGARANKG